VDSPLAHAGDSVNLGIYYALLLVVALSEGRKLRFWPPDLEHAVSFGSFVELTGGEISTQ
jgi:hypothetical protein